MSLQGSNFPHLTAILALQVDISIYQSTNFFSPKSFNSSSFSYLPGQEVDHDGGNKEQFLEGWRWCSNLSAWSLWMVLLFLITIQTPWQATHRHSSYMLWFLSCGNITWRQYWSFCQFNLELKPIISTCETIYQTFLALSKGSSLASKTKSDCCKSYLPINFHYTNRDMLPKEKFQTGSVRNLGEKRKTVASPGAVHLFPDHLKIRWLWPLVTSLIFMTTGMSLLLPKWLTSMLWDL